MLSPANKQNVRKPAFRRDIIFILSLWLAYSEIKSHHESNVLKIRLNMSRTSTHEYHNHRVIDKTLSCNNLRANLKRESTHYKACFGDKKSQPKILDERLKFNTLTCSLYLIVGEGSH